MYISSDLYRYQSCFIILPYMCLLSFYT